MARLYIGLSGYSYKPWQGEGRFYPVGLKQSKFLEFYTGRYNAVEMDGTWYKAPTEAAVAQWRDGVPDDFKFSFKMHRKVSHLSRLKPDCFEFAHFNVKRLYPLALAGKLGPVLLQLPPNLKRDDARLTAFLEAMPKNFSQVQGLEDGEPVPIRWAVEFRHASWNCDDVASILSDHQVGWVASDRDEERAILRDTSDFLYARLRRVDTDEAALDKWSATFAGFLEQGKSCYVYCKHEDEGSPWIWADYLLSKFSHS